MVALFKFKNVVMKFCLKRRFGGEKPRDNFHLQGGGGLNLKFMRATEFDFSSCTIYQSFEFDVTLSQWQLFHNKDTDKINWMQLSRY